MTGLLSGEHQPLNMEEDLDLDEEQAIWEIYLLFAISVNIHKRLCHQAKKVKQRVLFSFFKSESRRREGDPNEMKINMSLWCVQIRL